MFRPKFAALGNNFGYCFVHFPKTFKTASLSTLLSWPCSLNRAYFVSLRGPCGSCLLLRPP